MKKLLITFAAILSILNILKAQDNKTFSLVISKLQKDNKAFKQFVNLGKLHCTDMYSKKNSDLFTEKYLSLFNSLYPFPRLIDMDILKKEYTNYEKKMIKKTTEDRCSCIYTINESNLKLLYLKIVKNRKSYHNNEEYYLEEDMKDYLKRYMMNPDRFK